MTTTRTTSIPKVSVCIPVYNGERFIAETLQSALNQDFRDIEVVISDNASTDGTQRVVEGFSDARIRYERSTHNVGAVGNFNRCLDLARGLYLKILCADDLLYPTCLTRQVAIFDGDPEQAIALVSCARDIVDDQGRVRLRPRQKHFSGRIPAASAVRRSVLSGTNIFGEPQSVLIRTEQARRAGGFNPDYGFCLDLDYWFRLLALGDLYRIEEALCAFRVSDQSWSTGLSGKQALEFRRFLDDLQTRNLFPLSESDRAEGIRIAARNDRLRRLFYIWLSATKFLPFRGWNEEVNRHGVNRG